MIWKKLAQESTLAELIDRLNSWATDTDRLRKALFASRAASSFSQSLALNNSLQVDSTRVSGLVNGTTGAGSTETAAGSNTNVQFNTSGLLDGDDELTWKSTAKILGITGQVIVTGGVSAAGGFTLSTALTGTDGTFVNLTASTLTVTNRATVQSLAVSTLLGVTGAVDFASTLGVTGLIMTTGGLSSAGLILGTAGVSVTGGATLGSLGVASGATFNGRVQLAGGSIFVVSGFGVTPVTTNTGGIGSLSPLIRRFGHIVGATGNFSQVVCGTTLTAGGGNFTANSIDVTINTNLSIGNTISVAAGVEGSWVPSLSAVYPLGSQNLQWAGGVFSGLLMTAKGNDTAGATINLSPTGHTSGGNYFDVAGTTAITGFTSYDHIVDSKTANAGTRVLLHLDSNPVLRHSSSLVLASGWTFYGSTDDHVEFVKESANSADDVWRESSRAYGTLRSTQIQINPFAGQGSWSNMTTAESEFPGGSTEGRMVFDLSGYQYCRVSTSMLSGLTGAPGAFMYPQYSTDFSAWSSLSAGGGSAPSCRLDVVGSTAGSWVPMAAGARREVWIRIMGVSGDGAMDPLPGNISLELK